MMCSTRIELRTMLYLFNSRLLYCSLRATFAAYVWHSECACFFIQMYVEKISKPNEEKSHEIWAKYCSLYGTWTSTHKDLIIVAVVIVSYDVFVRARVWQWIYVNNLHTSGVWVVWWTRFIFAHWRLPRIFVLHCALFRTLTG